ncbi:MAG: GntR family transcriptional regulator [Hyphomicrobiaceae bacterium]
MTVREVSTWQTVQSEILDRIHSRTWKPGDLIPNEADLAREFGCARATVNRALRAVAEAGLVERRRKAGTRVTVNPVRRATFHIPIIRQEIEDRSLAYAYRLIASEVRTPPESIRARMHLNSARKALHIRAVHFADGTPYVYEDRWINRVSVPAIKSADLERVSANEWLVANVPFTDGDIAFSAALADAAVADILDIEKDSAVFVVERSTWIDGASVTSVRLTFAPGYRLHTIF